MSARLAVAASIWLVAAACNAATNPPQAAATHSSSQVGVRFTGAVSGTMTPSFGPSCQLPLPVEPLKFWVYRVIGSIEVNKGVAFEILVDDYKGPATYRNPGASVTVGPIGTDLKTSQTFRSNTSATLVVNADERSGNIEATLHAYPTYSGGNVSPATVHVQGTFSCKNLRPPAESP